MKNALELMKSDHETVKELFEKYESLSDRADNSKEQLARQITGELEVHAKLEETLFYPALRKKRSEDAKEAVREAVEEHLQMKRLINDIGKMTPQDEQFDAKMKVLREEVEHHVEEEENEMFQEAERLFAKSVLKELGMEMAKAKERLMTGQKAS